ncbi:MAG TPA: hypothetical protein VMU65_10375 [Candidatus Saccharimonadales bacterium]|nr:hypothetical protein [Candidatus Saccharimonadales bacterium]
MNIRAMATATPTASERARRVTVKVAYGTTEVEKAADSMDLQVSGEEVEAILATIDDELSTLATTATRAAIIARIFDELLIVAHAHSSGDDD